jgi:hypothetical protein
MVQVTIGNERQPALTYGDLGFLDQRTMNPSLAWKALLELAKLGGTIEAVPKGCEWASNWAAVEKRMQELRKTLRRHFKTDADPVPFKQGVGYTTAFNIDPGSAL